jgi:tRNA-specific 2-thiouridylase
MRVFLGMSGGVDSTVSAMLLKWKGYEVIGVYMTNWTECQREYQKVQSICDRLKIECINFNFVKDYWNFVFDPFLESIQKETPNPDIGCNQFIKFGSFYRKAMDLGADKIAFGHYCRTNGSQLLKSVDSNKDQTYYLSQIDGSILDKVLFPVGHLWKHQVKGIANANGFTEVSNQKESMGICFVGKQKFGFFIEEYIEQKSGHFVDERGMVLGEFRGISHFTVGQNARIPSQKTKYYVARKDYAKNEILVVSEPMHPLLLSKRVRIQPHFISKPFGNLYQVKYRYRTPCVNGRLVGDEVEFFHPQQGLCVGQQIALYQGEVCVGGGKVSHVMQD